LRSGGSFTPKKTGISGGLSGGFSPGLKKLRIERLLTIGCLKRGFDFVVVLGNVCSVVDGDLAWP
jgi:hypothetical protein